MKKTKKYKSEQLPLPALEMCRMSTPSVIVICKYDRKHRRCDLVQLSSRRCNCRSRLNVTKLRSPSVNKCRRMFHWAFSKLLLLGILICFTHLPVGETRSTTSGPEIESIENHHVNELQQELNRYSLASELPSSSEALSPLSLSSPLPTPSSLLEVPSASPAMSENVTLQQEPIMYYSRALQEVNLDDALKLFISEWQDRHGNRSRRSTPGHRGKSNHESDMIAVPSTVESSGHQISSNEFQALIDKHSDMLEPSDGDDIVTEDDQQRNCTQCVKHEAARVRRIESIKAHVLDKLRMKHAPNVTRRMVPKIPPLHQLIEIYGPVDEETRHDNTDQTMDEDEPMMMDQGHDPEEFEEFYVNAEKTIAFAQEPASSWNIPNELNAQYFSFSDKVLNSGVSSAHLWVNLRPNLHNEFVKDTQAWIVVYQVVKPKRGESPTLLHVHTKKTKLTNKKGSWVQMELKKLVSQWFRRPSDNFGLVIHSYDSEGRALVVTDPHKSGDNSLTPFIEIKIETRNQSRRRRMIGLNCEENSNEVRCCRYPLTVDFEEFGWDWIIAPKRYEANYCSGECPYVFLQKYPHTHLVQQANPSGSAGPCCAPKKMSSISMLYFDDNYNIIYGTLPGMVVDRCGCS